MTPNQLEALATPLGFCKAVLRLDCYAWNERILLDLDSPGAVAVRAANGVGKSSRIGAVAALWNCAVHPGSLTLCSAAVYRQVGEMFQAIRSHAAKFPQWEFLENEVRSHTGARIIGFTADRPELFEGFHSPELLLILDECKGIAEGIYAAALRCQPKRLLLLSSPGGRSGFFFECFTSRRQFFRTHAVSAFDAPHVSRQWIQEVIAQYGEQHPFTRSAVYGEFADSDADAVVIPLNFVERLLAVPPAFVDNGERCAFVDFSSSGDETVLAVRTGNRVELVDCWREPDTMKTVGRLIRLFQEHQLEPHEIRGDEGGLGRPMIDRLDESGWCIGRVNNGSPASNRDAYANVAAETWYAGRTLIERQQIILPNDRELIGQLTTRRGWPDSKGRLELETKQAMRARGLRSPDRADAILGTLAAPANNYFIVAV